MSGLQKAYQVLRLLGYACGLSGMGLFLAGTRAHPPRQALQTAGLLLLAVMFFFFLGSYVLWGAVRLKRRKPD